MLSIIEHITEQRYSLKLKFYLRLIYLFMYFFILAFFVCTLPQCTNPFWSGGYAEAGKCRKLCRLFLMLMIVWCALVESRRVKKKLAETTGLFLKSGGSRWGEGVCSKPSADALRSIEAWINTTANLPRQFWSSLCLLLSGLSLFFICPWAKFRN